MLHAVIAVPFQGRAYVLEVFEDKTRHRAGLRLLREGLTQ
jgi:hypothetical protein